jgi:hypothetical protein
VVLGIGAFMVAVPKVSANSSVRVAELDISHLALTRWASREPQLMVSDWVFISTPATCRRFTSLSVWMVRMTFFYPKRNAGYACEDQRGSLRTRGSEGPN